MQTTSRQTVNLHDADALATNVVNGQAWLDEYLRKDVEQLQQMKQHHVHLLKVEGARVEARVQHAEVERQPAHEEPPRALQLVLQAEHAAIHAVPAPHHPFVNVWAWA